MTTDESGRPAVPAPDGRTPAKPPTGAARGVPASERTAASVRQALMRIIFSDEFRSTPQLAAFLTFVVERTLAGQAQSIKGYTIAVEALGRPPEFDPQTDPIVRVEAMRLRRALAAYYAQAGADDPVRIVIPRGAYVPTFEDAAEAEADAADPDSPPADPPAAAAGHPSDPEPEPLPPRAVPAGSDPSGPNRPGPRPAFRPLPNRRGMPGRAAAALAGAVLIGLLAAGALTGVLRPGGAPSTAGRDAEAVLADAQGRPIVVLDAVQVAGVLPRSFNPALLRGMLLDGLARFDDIVVVDRATGGAEGMGSRYVLAVGAVGTGEGVSVSARLTHKPGGAVTWSRLFSAQARTDPTIPAELDMARQIATAVARPHGALLTDLSRRPDAAPRTRCLALAHAHWRNPAREAHDRARTCLEGELAGPNPAASVPANLALLVLDEWRAGFNPQPDPLGRALALARRAVEIGPDSPRARQALMAAHLASGAVEAGLRHGERALELNPYDTELLADLGARLIQAGRYREGLGLLRRAVHPDAPPWAHFFRFLAHLMLEERADALAAAARIETDGYAPGLIARAIAAADRNDGPAAALALKRLVALQPDYATDPAGVLAKRPLAPDSVTRLVDELKTAGLNAGP